MKKTKRQKFILTLLNKNNIKNQNQIVFFLKKEGFNTTQATISRDIKELSIKKIPTKNGLIYMQERKNDNKNYLKLIFKNSITSIDGVDSLVVIKTIPGSASTLAFNLDQKFNINKDILGTIAGDDTLLIILRNYDLREKWLNIFKKYFQED